MTKKPFIDLTIGDVVIATDNYSHDYNKYTIKITSEEFDEDFKTETNPEGKHFYGECLDDVSEFEDYITNVDEANYESFCYHSPELVLCGVFQYTENSKYTTYKAGLISEEEWVNNGSPVIEGIATFGDKDFTFLINKDSISLFYDDKEIDFNSLNIDDVWNDMWECENYIENNFLSNEEYEDEMDEI